MTLPNDSTSASDSPAGTAESPAQTPHDESPQTTPSAADAGNGATRPPWPHRAWPWVLIFVLALGIRFGYLNQIRNVPFVETPVGDAASYDAWARAIAAGDWWSREYTNGKTFYQAPAYPYFLAAVYGCCGDDPLTIRRVQALLGAVSCLLLGFAASRFFTRGVGLTAAILLALYAPAIFFDGLIQKTTLATLWMTLLLWLLSRQLDKPVGWRFLIAGLVLGLFGLTRENALVLAGAVLIWIGVGFRGAGWRARRTWTAHLVFGLLLVFYPVALRNFLVGGEWAITTVQAGPNFYIGNHAGATGRYVPLARGHETPTFERTDAKRLAEEATGSTLTDLEVSRYWFSQSWNFVRTDTGAWLRLLGAKFLLTINRYEITDTEGFNIYCIYAWMLGGLLAPVLHFGVIVPLAAAGVVLSLRRWRRLGVLYLMAFALIVAVVAFYVFARYRFPLAPIAILFAAAGIIEFYRCMRSRRIGALVAAALVIAPTAVIANMQFNPEERLDAMALANLGAVVAQRGDLDAAMRLFEHAVLTSPESPEPYYNIGMVYRVKGKTRAAIEYLLEAKKRAPDLSEVDFQLGEAFEAEGNISAALRFYQAALANNPQDADAAAAIERMSRTARP